MPDKKNLDSLKESTDSAKPARTRVAKTPKAPGTEEPLEAAARKAKSTVKKVAEAVSDTVREIADKVAGKPKKAPTPRKTASARAVSGDAKAPARRATTKADDSAPSSTPEKAAPRKSSNTKTGALTPDTTSEEVKSQILDSVSSAEIASELAGANDSATDVKAQIFQEHQGPPPPQPPRDLPDEYGDTKLVMLVRDPEWTYAYWEINDDTRNQLNFPRNADDRKRVVLRVYKITGRNWPEQAAHYFFDVEVPRDARNWYLQMPEVNEQWCAELGLFDEHDNFVSICRSNPVITPRDSISERVDSDWMTVEESFEKITRLSSESLTAQLRGESGPAGSEAIIRHVNRQISGMLHGEKMALSSGIFSSESAVPGKNKGFWLQVHTELILYGATEPDAKVTVQGQEVKLNADGTFSIRYALPDGEQILDVHAVNADGDLEESITPVVERTTR